MDEDLDLPKIYRRAVRRWPWISLATVAGGILGLIASLGRPPVYQASAVIEIGVDYSRTAPMQDLALEQAFDRVRALLLADATLEGAIGRIGAYGRLTPADMRSRIRLAHRLAGWELFVDGGDPSETAALANAWAEAALARIEEAARHALRAAEWQWALYGAGCELRLDETAPQTAVWVCGSDAGEGDPESVASALLEEASLSHGILPIFTYSLLQRANAPDHPVRWGRGPLILGGAIAGGMSGFVWISFVARPSGGEEQEGPRGRRARRRAQGRETR